MLPNRPWPGSRPTEDVAAATKEPPVDLSRRYIIDPVAFFIALFGGPILFTLATCWVMFIPVAALAIGGLPYLIVGTPVLLIHLSRNPVQPGDIAGVALSICTVLGLAAFAIAALFGADGAALVVLVITIMAAFFAACWGASFALLYQLLARDFFTQPL